MDLSSLAIELSQWLAQQDHVSIVAPVEVKIAKRTFAGARYAEDIEGQFAERLYVIDELPPLYRRSQRICFRTDDEDRDWFLTSWFRQVNICTEYEEACPFGNHFILTFFSSLESWESRQCIPKLRRLKMTVTEAGPTLSNITEYDSEENDDQHSWE